MMAERIMNTFGMYGGKTDSKNIARDIYGERFHADQTLYEYLIEFLLVFSSPKSNDYESGRMEFHSNTNDLRYYAERKMGLKRFIFYNASKKDTSIPFDKDAYDYLISAIAKKIDQDDTTSKHYISYLQDLLRGYAVVLRKRSWCAQQTLPICPELIFCEAMPDKKKREKPGTVISGDDISVDSSFEFSKRNFLARGGELYYLHILKAIADNGYRDKKRIEDLLTILLTQQSKAVSKIARFIQDVWVERIGVFNRNELYQEYSIAWIPADAYGKAGDFSVSELINFLSASIQQIKKIEIFAEGMILQIMRMLYTGACYEAKIPQSPWIIDMSGGESSQIKKISSHSFRKVEDDFKTAINAAARDLVIDPDDIPKRIKEAQSESLDIFRTKGKEIRCIIPISGQFERFSMSENILRFLVLSIIAPGSKMTLESFMEKLYEHFNMVIGPKQYREALQNCGIESETSNVSILEDNIKYFQKYLSSIGCLKELSDATSIVINAYSMVEGD